MARPKSEEKYEAILKATLELVTAEGFHGLSMSKIGKKAKVAPATIYIYFENTESIINQLYMDLKSLVAKDIMKGYKLEMKARDACMLIWRNYFEVLITYKMEYTFLEQFSNSPFITHVSREEGMRQFQPLMDFFERAMERGEIKKMPQSLIFPLFYAPLAQLAKNVIAGHLMPTEEILDLAMECTWDSLSTN